MPEIFNPNPTVFAPLKSSARKPPPTTGLWLREDHEPSDDSDEMELIDQDEIFGKLLSYLRHSLF
jgi:hypothetical protein